MFVCTCGNGVTSDSFLHFSVEMICRVRFLQGLEMWLWHCSRGKLFYSLHLIVSRLSLLPWPSRLLAAGLSMALASPCLFFPNLPTNHLLPLSFGGSSQMLGPLRDCHVSLLDGSTRRTDQKTMLTLYHCQQSPGRWLLLGRRRQKQLQQMRQQPQAEETAGAVRASSTRNRFCRPTRFNLLLFLFSSLWICGIKLYVQVVHQTSFVKPTRLKVVILFLSSNQIENQSKQKIATCKRSASRRRNR